MTPFEHLAVLISIVIGVGLTHLLTSVHRLVQARDRVRLYWLPLLWVTLIFITLIEWWWASFGFRQHTVWNFFYFLFVLLSPVTLYLAAAFVLPELEPGGRYDLRTHYYENRRWFFAFVAVGPLLDGVRRALQAGDWSDFGAVSNLVSFVLVGLLAVTARPWIHTVVTLGVATLFGFFIVSSAVELR
jgi:hypothetical protein